MEAQLNHEINLPDWGGSKGQSNVVTQERFAVGVSGEEAELVGTFKEDSVEQSKSKGDTVREVGSAFSNAANQEVVWVNAIEGAVVGDFAGGQASLVVFATWVAVPFDAVKTTGELVACVDAKNASKRLLKPDVVHITMEGEPLAVGKGVEGGVWAEILEVSVLEEVVSTLDGEAKAFGGKPEEAEQASKVGELTAGVDPAAVLGVNRHPKQDTSMGTSVVACSDALYDRILAAAQIEQLATQRVASVPDVVTVAKACADLPTELVNAVV